MELPQRFGEFLSDLARDDGMPGLRVLAASPSRSVISQPPSRTPTHLILA